MDKDPATLDYLRQQGVADLIDEAVQALVKDKPADARAWLAEYLGRGGEEYPPRGLSAGVKKLEGWIQVGCGDKPYNCPEKNATFGLDGKCPDEMPDLSKHSTSWRRFC